MTWWSRPFLFWMISGTLVVIGLVLNRTSWENRISVVLLVAFVVALLSLSKGSSTPQLVSMAWPGLIVVVAIWGTGLLLGSMNGRSGSASKGTAGSDSGKSPPGNGSNGPTPGARPAAATPVMSATGETIPAGTVAPAPEVSQQMDELMGGAR